MLRQFNKYYDTIAFILINCLSSNIKHSAVWSSILSNLCYLGKVNKDLGKETLQASLKTYLIRPLGKWLLMHVRNLIQISLCRKHRLIHTHGKRLSLISLCGLCRLIWDNTLRTWITLL